MPATNAGNDTARLKASQSSQSGQQDPPAPPQSRRKSTPPVSRLARASQSRRPRNARKPSCRRQIPIDRTGRTAAPNPPAVSSLEACPTPAVRARRSHRVTADVRQPFTTTDLQRHSHLRPLLGVKRKCQTSWPPEPRECCQHEVVTVDLLLEVDSGGDGQVHGALTRGDAAIECHLLDGYLVAI
jgi:hypothetical protein